MAEDEDDLYVCLSNTENVVLVAGEQNDEISIPKGMLALRSKHFENVLKDPDAQPGGNAGRIELQGYSTTTVKSFVRWCLEGRLEKRTSSHYHIGNLSGQKAKLIRLCIFSDQYNIPGLQNQSITLLSSLLAANPNLLTRDDARLIFERTASPHAPLRNLTALILVSQLEPSDSQPTTTIEQYEKFAQDFAGFATLLFSWLRVWLKLDLKAAKPIKGVSKLQKLMREQTARRVFHIDEYEPSAWVLSLAGAPPPPPQTSHTGYSVEEPILLD